MIACWEHQGKKAYSKINKDNGRTVDVVVPGKPCRVCAGHGKVKLMESKTAFRIVACEACWGEMSPMKSIRLKKSRVEVLDSVSMVFPSPAYWSLN